MTEAPGAPELTVVSPVYSAEGCIEELVARLTAVLRSLGDSYEIILVDDRSPDRSWDRISAIAASDPHVRALRLSRNFGQHTAIAAGLDLARGKWIVVMDCDLQDPPEAIPLLLDKAREGNQIVFARKAVDSTPWYERLTSIWFYRLLSKFSNLKIDERLTNFSVLSADAAAVVRSMRERLRFHGGLLFWIGLPYATVDFVRAERFSGSGSYTFLRRLALAARNVVAYSTRVLEYSTFVGLSLAFAAAAFALLLLILYFTHGEIPSGWTSLALLITFFGGLQAALIGVIGLYLRQVFDEVRRRPLYVVAESINLSSAGGQVDRHLRLPAVGH